MLFFIKVCQNTTGLTSHFCYLCLWKNIVGGVQPFSTDSTKNFPMLDESRIANKENILSNSSNMATMTYHALLFHDIF